MKLWSDPINGSFCLLLPRTKHKVSRVVLIRLTLTCIVIQTSFNSRTLRGQLLRVAVGISYEGETTIFFYCCFMYVGLQKCSIKEFLSIYLSETFSPQTENWEYFCAFCCGASYGSGGLASWRSLFTTIILTYTTLIQYYSLPDANNNDVDLQLARDLLMFSQGKAQSTELPVYQHILLRNITVHRILYVLWTC